MAVHGTIYDVVVDIRKGSPTYGTWQGFELSSDNYRQLYIPPGCAHGFCVTSEEAAVLYKCTGNIEWSDLHGVSPGVSPSNDHPTEMAGDRRYPDRRGTIDRVDRSTAEPLLSCLSSDCSPDGPISVL